MKPKRLSFSLVAFAVLLTGTLVAFGLGTRDNFQDWYLINIRGPQLEREFGFAAAFEKFADSSGTWTYYTLTNVDPKGVLGRAGVHSRDIPVGYMHGFQTGFLYTLAAASRGEEVRFRVVSQSDLMSDVSAWRRITLPARSQP